MANGITMKFMMRQILEKNNEVLQTTRFLFCLAIEHRIGAVNKISWKT